jgi:taurine dioxygenase
MHADMRLEEVKTAFSLKQLNGALGAEVDHIDLSKPLPDEVFAELRAAFVRYQVLVFRNQDISLDQQIEFGRRFGELSVHPFSPNRADKPEAIQLDYSKDNPPELTDVWHSDETFRATPPLATILHCLVCPAHGGDTMFASMIAAYRGLSDEMKRYVHGLEAQHDFKPFRTLFSGSAEHTSKLRALEDRFPNPWHPVVRVHPETGARALFVNPQFTTRIRGLKQDESDTVLQYLYRQASVPEYQLRVKWAPDTVVMWDNRSVQHYAVHDYYPQPRKMDRITVAGDAPRGVAGSFAPEEHLDNHPQILKGVRAAGAGPKRQFDRA